MSEKRETRNLINVLLPHPDSPTRPSVSPLYIFRLISLFASRVRPCDAANLLVSLDTPSEGEILYRGTDITKLKGEELRNNRQNIQMVFQDPTLSFIRK